MLDHSVIEQVQAAARNGAKIFIARNYWGRVRVKIVKGPLGLTTTRLSISTHELEQLCAGANLHAAGDKNTGPYRSAFLPTNNFTH